MEAMQGIAPGVVEVRKLLMRISMVCFVDNITSNATHIFVEMGRSHFFTTACNESDIINKVPCSEDCLRSLTVPG